LTKAEAQIDKPGGQVTVTALSTDQLQRVKLNSLTSLMEWAD